MKPVEIRVPDAFVKRMNNDVHVGIHVLTKLREAGVPVIGVLWPHAVQHGRLESWSERDLDDCEEHVWHWTPDPNYVAPAINQEDDL